MLNIFKRHQPQQMPPDFPTVADLPALSQADAKRAIWLLRLMVNWELCKVYAAYSHDGWYWQVWDDVLQQRLTLLEWHTAKEAAMANSQAQQQDAHDADAAAEQNSSDREAR